MLLGIIEAYLIKLFEMYTYWGKIVYAEESLAFFEAPLGGIIYGFCVACIIIASIAIPGEALFNLGDENEKDIFNNDESICPFIFSLKRMPATQTKLAMEGLTYERLKPYVGDHMMLFKVLSSGGPRCFRRAGCHPCSEGVQQNTC
ncbi:unnamed protein product [Symbiodinium pilosum]|uniref:Uncharacterized protein n=1 Tax=Symbiodinium pilosum TaxID=2952 RepID=A0A812VUM0_SYMPI|nr:unnamed protein product [Symbiodinium pilosum]